MHRGMEDYLDVSPTEDATCLERLRDRTLQLLAHPVFVWLAVLWVLNVVGWVLVFVSCLMHWGWITPLDVENEWAQNATQVRPGESG